jgi:kynureninase
MSMLKRPEIARQLDAKDPLARFRTRFHMPRHGDGEAVYLCGNSLGLQPVTAAALVQETLEDWQRLAVRAHFEARHPWMPYHELATSRMAQLVGAEPIEVVCMNSLTVNLHLMMVSFYRPTTQRHRILMEVGAFPSDRYAVESQIRFHGYDPREALVLAAPRPGESSLRMEDLEALIQRNADTLALVLLPGVQYYTGEVYDFERIVRAARRRGIPIGLDLAHAVGNVPLQLHEWEVDFAVWCSYKYLNAGPGAVAGCFVHERYARDTERPRFAGWWGHDKASRFQMGPRFAPIPGAEGWQLSNPPILSFAPLLASLEIFAEAGMDALRAKSLQLSGYLEMLLKDALGEQLDILTPLAPSQRGCQLSVRLLGGATRGRALLWQLEARGIVCDWREPDVIRVAPVPLYNRFADVHQFVATIAELLRG